MNELHSLLLAAKDSLKQKAVPEAELSAELLLSATLGVERYQLFIQRQRQLTEKEQTKFSKLLKRRLIFEPLAYILGKKEFYSRSFFVDKRALIPRPETEILAEQVISTAEKYNLKNICEVGCGSAALAITIVLESNQDSSVDALDISQDALNLAEKNIRLYQLEKRISLIKSNLLEKTEKKYQLIVANLPYCKSAEISLLENSVKDFEPHIALDGGGDGLSEIAKLIGQAQDKLMENGYLLLEIGQGQASQTVELLKRRFNDITISKDLAGIARVVSCRL